jgi:hypothetical protein
MVTMATPSRGPTKLEVLDTLLHVLHLQKVEARRAAADRGARAATDEHVLGAIRGGENTWERLHAHFPEHEWKALKQTLDRLQRQGQIHRNEHLDFRLGPRGGRRWTASGGYGDVRRSKKKTVNVCTPCGMIALPTDGTPVRTGPSARRRAPSGP